MIDSLLLLLHETEVVLVLDCDVDIPHKFQSLTQKSNSS
jgi:hypothetical protein